MNYKNNRNIIHHFQVYQLLHGEQYYETFIQSKVYVKLLDEFGFTNNI